MSERTRLYDLAYPLAQERPVWLEDAGTHLRITGLVLEGMGMCLIAFAPWSGASTDFTAFKQLDLATWCDLLRLTDDPQVYEEDASGTVKAVHRKAERAASGMVQQQVWARDGFQCMYCARPMGEVLLTLDHFVPLEQGGARTPDNLLSACGACNRKKGARAPKEFCFAEGYDYTGLVAYLEGRASRAFLGHLLR